jgi:hypothetical protein
MGCKTLHFFYPGVDGPPERPGKFARLRHARGPSPTSTRNPASPDTCTRRAAKWARLVQGRLRLCHRGRATAFVPGACGAAAWQASDSRRGRAPGLCAGHELGGSLGPRAWDPRRGRAVTCTRGGVTWRTACGCVAATYGDLRPGDCCASKGA